MKKSKIASLNAEISLLGFGLMRLPILDGKMSNIDYPKAQDMIDRAYKAGVNYYDTAYLYHEGKSEVFAGETLSKYPRDSYYLASKMPSWEKFTSEADLERIFNEQLERCKTSYFDFYLAHSLGDDRMDNLKNYIYGFLCKKKKEGLIHRMGFSFHDHPDVLDEIVKNYQWDFGMIQLNYLDWEINNAKRLYETLAEHKIPILIMEPVKGGTLSNKLNDKVLGIIKKADPASSTASLALRFAASFSGVATILSGMTEPEHVEDNLRTFEDIKPLSDEEQKILEEAAQIYRTSGIIPCTDCRYCIDVCPSGVNIPEVLVRYNHHLVNKILINFINQYRVIKKSEQAHNCTSCGLCIKHCPQGIDIPKYLKEVVDCLAV